MTADPNCPRCASLRDEVSFWQEQQRFASSMVATIADLDEVAPALRQMLRTEIEHRKQIQAELDRATLELQRLNDLSGLGHD